jgi:hypothetical protein
MKNLVIVILLVVSGYLYWDKSAEVKPVIDTLLQSPIAHPPQAAHEAGHPSSHPTVQSETPTSINVTQVAQNGEIHQHDGLAHHSHDVSDNQTKTGRWLDIKNRICLAGSPVDRCIVDSQLNIQTQIIDEASGNAKAIDISHILTSTDFSSVMAQLVDTRSLPEAYKREQDLNARIYDILTDVDHIQSNGLVCGDVACAASFVYQQKKDWNAFGQSFFTADAKLGSLFSFVVGTEQDGDIETRIIFLPNHLTTIQ